jgi:hypothetical protein
VPLLSLVGIFTMSLIFARQSATVASGFVFETAPFASAHTSTIADTKDGLVKRRRVKHVEIDPVRLKAVPMTDGNWPRS